MQREIGGSRFLSRVTLQSSKVLLALNTARIPKFLFKAETISFATFSESLRLFSLIHVRKKFCNFPRVLFSSVRAFPAYPRRAEKCLPLDSKTPEVFAGGKVHRCSSSSLGTSRTPLLVELDHVARETHARRHRRERSAARVIVIGRRALASSTSLASAELYFDTDVATSLRHRLSEPDATPPALLSGWLARDAFAARAL